MITVLIIMPSKRIYGGKFSNRHKKRILKESALIEVYKNV
jgi:hypothetical protein